MKTIVLLFVTLSMMGVASCRINGPKYDRIREVVLPTVNTNTTIELSTLEVHDFTAILDTNGDVRGLNGRLIDQSGFDRVNDALKERGNGPLRYCCLFCNKEQTIQTLERKVIRKLVTNEETQVLILGFVVTKTGLPQVNERVLPVRFTYLGTEGETTKGMSEEDGRFTTTLLKRALSGKVNMKVVSDETFRIYVDDTDVTVQDIVDFLTKYEQVRRPLFVLSPLSGQRVR